MGTAHSNLIAAIRRDDTDHALHLIKHCKSHINAEDERGVTPISAAINHDNVTVLNALLRVPGIVVPSDSLYAAVQKGSREMVAALLAVPGIDVNYATKPESAQTPTPLARAIYDGNTDIVLLLLAAPGIDVYNPTPALVSAIQYRREEVFTALLAMPGIDVNRGGALDLAASSLDRCFLTQLLAAPGLAINQGAPLYWATINNFADNVRDLLAVPGIDVNKWNPLWNAANKGFTRIAKMLLAMPGIDVNNPSEDGVTPLEIAAFRGHVDVVLLLIEHPETNKTRVQRFAEADRYTPVINKLILQGARISSMPAFVAKQLLTFQIREGGVCPVTFEPLAEGDAAVLPCGHVFSREGLRRAEVCPVCRKSGIPVNV